MKKLLPYLPIVVLVVLAAFLVGQLVKMGGQGRDYKPDALVGQAIPETVLPLLREGRAVDEFLDLKTAGVGKPMIVNLFASWCAPCRLEHEQLMALKADGIAIVGVAYKDDPVATQAFIDELGDPFSMILVDREGRAGLDLGVSGVPESFAVDAYGQIVAKASGPILTDEDRQRLVEALRAPPR